MKQEQEFHDGNSTEIERETIEITRIEPLKSKPAPFKLEAQFTPTIIKQTLTNEPEMSVELSDIVPVIPQIINKVVFMKDWKTSAIGFGGALIVALGDYMQSGGKMTLGGVGAALGLAALGWFGSDKKK